MTGKLDMLVLASNNPKKAKELAAILAPLGIELVRIGEFPGFVEPEETGDTFEENATIKARYAAGFTGLPALADDSGLVVDCLGGAPGVRSARFAGDGADDAMNNRLLLDKMAGVAAANRGAAFVSVVALALPNGEVRTWRGETRGRILTEGRGDNGFGYDPLFLSDDLGSTFAEAADVDKNRVSHRGRALAAFAESLKRSE